MASSDAPKRLATPDAFDFLDVGALLSDEERLIRDTVRDFVKDRVLPVIDDWFERGYFDQSVIKELGSMGLLGMHLHGYGCAGTNAVSYGITCMEMEAGDSGFRSAVSVQGSLSMWPIWKYGSEEQKERWLPAMAAGELIGCFGLTEPDFGSDPSRMRAFARRDGDDWVLSGTKMWITNGGVADLAVVWARTEEGVRGVIVPRDTRGFSTRDILGATGITLEYPVIRHVHNLEWVCTEVGTNEIHTLVLGEAVTGLRAFDCHAGRSGGPGRVSPFRASAGFTSEWKHFRFEV